jgi:transposase-like protein
MVLGMMTGPSEAEPFWTDFLRSLTDRGLRDIKLMVADDHKGLRAAATKVLHATLQCCWVPSAASWPRPLQGSDDPPPGGSWMRNRLGRVPASQSAGDGRGDAAHDLRPSDGQDAIDPLPAGGAGRPSRGTEEAAREQRRKIADSLRKRLAKIAQLMDGAEQGVLAHRTFAKEHWPQLASTSPLERLNREIKRRTNVVGIGPDAPALVRLAGWSIPLKQSDAWTAARRRY